MAAKINVVHNSSSKDKQQQHQRCYQRPFPSPDEEVGPKRRKLWSSPLDSYWQFVKVHPAGYTRSGGSAGSLNHHHHHLISSSSLSSGDDDDDDSDGYESSIDDEEDTVLALMKISEQLEAGNRTSNNSSSSSSSSSTAVTSKQALQGDDLDAAIMHPFSLTPRTPRPFPDGQARVVVRGEGSSGDDDLQQEASYDQGVDQASASATDQAPPPHHHHPLFHGCDDHWSWNTKDKSHEVKLNGPKHRISLFHPNWSNGTAGVRGTRALNNGRFYWEINVSHRIFGTSLMFGIGTKKARLHVDGFVNMLGEDENSWGLSHRGYLWHDGDHKIYTWPFEENVATTVGLYFDGVAGTLTYFKDGACLGVAFQGLNEVAEPLYPMVCSTAAKTEMALGVTKREYASMQDRCRAVILRHIASQKHIQLLRLPRTMQQYIADGLSEDSQDDLALAQNNQSTPTTGHQASRRRPFSFPVIRALQ